jgi:membrane dipeptidase
VSRRGVAVLVVLIPAAVGITLLGVGANVERFANRVHGAAPPPSPGAAALHRASRIVDLHADSLLWGRDLSRRSSVGHVDLPRSRDGNVTLHVFTTVTRFPLSASIERTDPRALDLITLLAVTNGWPWRCYRSLTERVLYQAQRLDRLAASDDHVVVVRRREDLDRLLAIRETDARWIGAILGIEGAHALDRPTALDEVYAAGVRLIGLAHFFDNDYAGSAHGTAKGGLTAAGRELVAAMERRGIVVDLAHSSSATIRDVLAIAHRPPVVSHTGVKGTCDNARNLSDEELRAIASAGGVIGIGYWPTAVCGEDPAAIARAIRHAVDVAGIDHVALGSDFDGAVTTPFDSSRLDAVTDAMLAAGMPQESVRRVLGENALGLLRQLLPQ